jgi:hypothetical protein
MLRNSSRVILLSAVLAPDAFTLTPLEEADEEVRAKLLMPAERVVITEAHDLRLNDFVDDVVEGARDGDLSRWDVSGGVAVVVEPALMAGGVDPGDSDCLTVDGLLVEGLWVKNTACWSTGGWSIDMRVPGVSTRFRAKKSCGRASSRWRALKFLIRRSFFTDLKKRTRTSMVWRSLGLQSSILRSGRRFFRCLCELRCLSPSRVNQQVRRRHVGQTGVGAMCALVGGLRTSDQTNHL